MDTKAASAYSEYIVVVENHLSIASGFLTQYIKGDFVDIKEYPSIDIVRLCRVYIEAYNAWATNPPFPTMELSAIHTTQTNLDSYWAALWESMHNGLVYYWDNKVWRNPDLGLWAHSNLSIPTLSNSSEFFEKDQVLAGECIAMISEMEDRGLGNGELGATFPAKLSKVLQHWATAVGESELDLDEGVAAASSGLEPVSPSLGLFSIESSSDDSSPE